MANGKRGRPKKDPFDLLTAEFKDAVAGENAEQINLRIAEIAKAEFTNIELMKADPDLQAAKAEVKTCSQQYRDNSKTNGQKIAFCRQVLGDQGKDNTGGQGLAADLVQAFTGGTGTAE